MIAIKNSWDASVIFTSEESQTMLEAVKKASEQKIVLSLADLRGADLSGADLRCAYLTGAYLTGAYLAGVDLSGEDLCTTDLSGANLRGANLRGANLILANLSGADLTGADLSGADLRRADLSHAELSGANLRRTNLRSVDLRGANLSLADLRDIRNDFWDILICARSEVAGLRQAIVDGRIDGKAPKEAYACLVGTIASIRQVSFDELEIKKNSSSLIEQFFLGIKKGDTPEGNPISKIVLDWIDEFQTSNR